MRANLRVAKCSILIGCSLRWVNAKSFKIPSMAGLGILKTLAGDLVAENNGCHHVSTTESTSIRSETNLTLALSAYHKKVQFLRCPMAQVVPAD